MKIRTVSYLLLLSSVTLLSACDKEDENIDTSTTKLVGKWNLDKKSINGSEMELSECDKKENYEFRSNSQLITIKYSGELCDVMQSSNWNFYQSGNTLTYSNQTAGHNGSELTRKYNIVSLTDNFLQLELTYEIDGIGEEGDVADKVVTTWVKNK
jgi:hypothetical protein